MCHLCVKSDTENADVGRSTACISLMRIHIYPGDSVPSISAHLSRISCPSGKVQRMMKDKSVYENMLDIIVALNLDLNMSCSCENPFTRNLCFVRGV